MRKIDYSIHSDRFHNDTEEHAERMAGWLRAELEPFVPIDRTISVLAIGCGYGFALRALCNLGFSRLLGLEISSEQAERCQNAGFDVVVAENTTKGIGRFPRRLWRRSTWPAIRKWLVRWCWLQVFKAEIPWEKLDQISFELNLKAVATKG